MACRGGGIAIDARAVPIRVRAVNRNCALSDDKPSQSNAAPLTAAGTISEPRLARDCSYLDPIEVSFFDVLLHHPWKQVGKFVSVDQDPKPEAPNHGFIASATRYIHERPLLHFISGEINAGVASVMVYAGFVMVSYAIEGLTERFPLKYAAPGHFLDVFFAWCTALSGALTFSMITVCSIFRLGRQLIRQPY